jgi:NAD(P)H-flavin reductase
LNRHAPALAENPWLSQTVKVAGIVPELSGVATYQLRFVDVALHERYQFQPGQFNMLYLPGAGEIAISLSAGSARRTWDHTVRTVGNVTSALSRLRVGDSLGVRGPYGSHWPIEDCRGADLLFIAGGIGLAPLRSALYACLNRRQEFGRITLLFGARSPDMLLYEREFSAWAQNGVDIQITVDRDQPGWAGNIGVVTMLVDRLQTIDPGNSRVLMCGPEVMMRYTVRSALRRGIGKDQMWVSLERNMQCAVGLCGHCQLGPTFVCKDGPIFRYDKVESFLDVQGL